MGSGHSVESRQKRLTKPSNKLSKPRTNSTPNLLNLIQPPTSVQSSEKALDEAPKSQKQSRRRSLFRSRSAQLATRTSLPEADTVLLADKHVDERLHHRYSRNSIVTHIPASEQNDRSSVPQVFRRSSSCIADPDRESRRSSVIGQTFAIQAQTSVSDFADVSPDENRLRYGESSHESLAENIICPMRRRSLLTPGIATRADLGAAQVIDRRSSVGPGHIQHGREYWANSSRNDSPPRRPVRSHTVIGNSNFHDYYNKQAATALELKRPLYDFSTIEPRTATPSDLDSRPTGAFALGSLRITNGTASPSFSVLESNTIRCVEPEWRLDNFEKQDGDNSQDDNVDHQRPEAARGDYLAFKENKTTMPKLCIGRETFEPDLEAAFSRNADNLRLLTFSAENEVAQPCHGDSGRIMTTTIESQQKPLQLFTLNHPDHQFDRCSPTRASDMAHLYISDIAGSPFSFEDTATTPTMQTTSKHTAEEDDLFEEDICGTLPTASPADTTYTSQVTTVTTVRVNTQPSNLSNDSASITQSGDLNFTSLEKADSGYNSVISSSRSSSSLRSSKEGLEIVPGTTQFSSATSAIPQQIHMVDTASVHKGHAFTIPTTEQPRELYGMLIPAAPASTTVRPPIPGRNKSARQTVAMPPTRDAPLAPTTDLVLPTCDDVTLAALTKQIAWTPTNTSKNQTASSSSRRSWQARLLSGLSDSESSPSSMAGKAKPGRTSTNDVEEVVVQQHRDIATDELPEIPAHAIARLEQRLPPLTHTYKSIHKTSSKETLATIGSSATVEPRVEEEAARFKRFSGALPPPPFPANHEIEQRIRNMPEIQQPLAVTDKSASSTSKQRIPRKSIDSTHSRTSLPSYVTDEYQEAFELHITSFGTVSESLGASPYELAMTAMHPNRRPQSMPANVQHNPSRGRTIGMNSMAAAQFARDKSESRKEMLKNHDHEFRDSFYDKRAVSGSAHIRVLNPGEEIPPVPALPANLTGNQIGMAQSTIRKKKSPPPVSMTTRGKKLPTIPPNNPQTPPPSTPEIDLQNQIKLDRQQTSDGDCKGTAADIPPPGIVLGSPHAPDWTSLPSQRRLSEPWRPPHRVSSTRTRPQFVQPHFEQSQDTYKHAVPKYYPAPHQQFQYQQPSQRPQRSQSYQPQWQPNQHYVSGHEGERGPLSKIMPKNQQIGRKTNIRASGKTTSTSSAPDSAGVFRQPSLVSRNTYDTMGYTGAHPRLEASSASAPHVKHGNVTGEPATCYADSGYTDDGGEEGGAWMVLDRYSGGMGYGYSTGETALNLDFGPDVERRAGSGDDGAKWKRKNSVDAVLGVDWCDVPVSSKRLTTLVV